MRILANLVLALVLVLGIPVAAPSAEAGIGCAMQVELDGGGDNPCSPADNVSGMTCGAIGGTCQVPAVLMSDTMSPHTSPETTRFTLPSAQYRSPDLLGLFRPPNAHSI